MKKVLHLTWLMVTLIVSHGADCTGAELMGIVSTERPDGAVVLYDGSGTNLFLSMTGSSQIDWPEVDGALVSTRDSAAPPDAKRANHLVSKLHFRDAQIHVEFMLPEEGSGNSGVYIHGNYELQIYNSFGVEKVSQNDMGAIYGFSKPLANQCRPPGVWQAYDVTYRAPRRDATGTIVENGSITAWLNGVKVQDDTPVGEPRSQYHPYRHGVTPYLRSIWERQQETCTGPVFLQDHDSPVRFRNVWILPLDDVRIRPVADPSSALLRSFALQLSKEDREIDPRRVSVGATGNPLPLRRVTARDGVLRYEGGTEVALWGVNVQTSISWEYNGRLKPLGVPHTADALKEISARNLDHMPLVGAGVIRVHLLPADFSGPDGEIRDTICLDVLDDLLAQCRNRGIYVYLTLMNEMNDRFCSDSFVVGHERVLWVFDPLLAAKSRRYVHEFLDRKNRYTGVRYADDSTIAVIEILNEPHYPTLQSLRSEASLQACAAAFDAWRSEQQGDATPKAIYPAYRYELLRDYLNRMCATVRGTGCPAPVVWNLNWPRMINDHEDVFQAASDSAVDGVSFCCYPGQSDVAHPFWANPADLSVRNYLPYLQTCYRDYSYLRWLLGTRFEKKAKMTYEFESMYNHSAYLYPAMARLFRSLGSQIATMWQYTLSPVAEYRAGSHYLNAYCTPRKAASFRIARNVFALTPRHAPFELAAKTEMVGPRWAVSFDRDLSLWQSDAMFLHSDDVDWNPLGLPEAPEIIAGCGNSPLVTYSGTGLYVLEFDGDRAELLILPDVRYTYPPWQRKGSGPLDRVCELDRDAVNTFELHLAGWTDGVEIARLEGAQAVPLTTDDSATRFRAQPGQYRLTRTTSEEP